MKRLIVVLAFVFLCIDVANHAAEVPLAYMPNDTEVIIGANVQQIMNSNLVKNTYLSTPQATAQLEVVKNLTGIDLMSDVQNLFFYGRVDNKEAGGVILRGKFDEQKVLTLLQANPKYQTETIGGQAVHQWWEEKEKKTKYGMFLANGLAVVYNSRAALDASLAAVQDRAKSLAPAIEFSALLAEATPNSAWLVMVNLQHQGQAERYKIQSLLGTVNLAVEKVDLALSITPQAGEDVQKWTDLLEGVVSLAELQPDHSELRNLAATAKVAPSSDSKSVRFSASLDQAQLQAILKKKSGQ